MSYSTYGVEIEKQNGLVIGKHFDNLDDVMCVVERAVYERVLRVVVRIYA